MIERAATVLTPRKTMNEEELKLAIYTPPFEPKRIRLSNGQTYDVRWAGAIAIGHRTCAVVVDGLIHTVANIHIAQVEPLSVGVP
jgi:hypothetical protein